ncbi:MAG: hydrolase, partial [Candidatus Saccharibacteria bacterium]|nr:hydrolase [Candidatus Saccharibacteria bacterium]
EQLDRVNERDEIIGTTDKVTAHRERHLHRVAAVFIFAPDGRLYVQHHKNSGLLDNSVGGHVVKGESYDAAASREAAEEVGLNDPLTYVTDVYTDDRSFTEGVAMHMIRLYECTPSPEWSFVPNDEVEELELMELEEVVDHVNERPEDFTRGFIRSLAAYIQVRHLPYKLKMPEWPPL